jgi:hypothetical protein
MDLVMVFTGAVVGVEVEMSTPGNTLSDATLETFDLINNILLAIFTLEVMPSPLFSSPLLCAYGSDAPFPLFQPLAQFSSLIYICI